MSTVRLHIYGQCAFRPNSAQDWWICNDFWRLNPARHLRARSVKPESVTRIVFVARLPAPSSEDRSIQIVSKFVAQRRARVCAARQLGRSLHRSRQCFIGVVNSDRLFLAPRIVVHVARLWGAPRILSRSSAIFGAYAILKDGFQPPLGGKGGRSARAVWTSSFYESKAR